MSLRELTTADARAVRRIYSGSSVHHLGRAEMVHLEAHHYVERAARWAREGPRARYILGIDKADDLVGVIKLDITGATDGRLGYILRDDVWGRGFATEAVVEVLALAFGSLRLTTIGAKHRSTNPASGRVLAKAGFTCVGAAGEFVHYTASPGR
ncbi:GNAT family N-acetyltransferase [Streptomyces sp. Y1]|uniref:GNAT family N-acetyltransferase n=1 Tax=Streptomyces sp. Y1 TaxID=3238634 RepID=A0AB39TQJ5_9ACTN